MAAIVKVQARHFRNVVLQTGDCISVPPLYFGRQYSSSIPADVTKIYGRVQYVSESVPEVKVKWDIDGLQEIVKTSKIELEERSTPIQTIVFPDYCMDENEQGTSKEASKTHTLYDHLEETKEDIQFCMHTDSEKKDDDEYTHLNNAIEADEISTAISVDDGEDEESCENNEYVRRLPKSTKPRKERKGKNKKRPQPSTWSSIESPKSTVTPSETTIAPSETTVTPSETTITPSETSFTLSETSFTLSETNDTQSIKRRKRRKTKEIVSTNTVENEFVTLCDALDEAQDITSDGEEVDVVLLPPVNSYDGDTDKEFGDDDNLSVNTLDNVREVAGTIEIQSTRNTSRVSKPKKVYAKLPPNYKQLVRKQVLNVGQIIKDDIDHDRKVNSLIESAGHFDSLRNWKGTDKNHENKGLTWKTRMSQENEENFEKLNTICAGKMPVEIFELLFNETLQDHVVSETTRYANINSNDVDFKLTTNDFKSFIGVLLLSGYHSLPQQRLYWERNMDVDASIVYKSISRNRFMDIKKYIHFADNSTIELTDKFAKVRPLYDLSNANLQQFGFWHYDYSIDEQMIPYYGMHSAKQTMRLKSVRFGYKNFVISSSDGYPYELIPYCGAKGIGGTPGKDLTTRVVIDLVLKCYSGIGNLSFDNWYSSARLMSLLTAMEVPTICTVRADRIGKAPIKSSSALAKGPRGEFSYAFDDSLSLHCINWMDNGVVTMLSNCTGPYPLQYVDRFSKAEQKKVLVQQPQLIKLYNKSMGGVDLVDAAVATYRPNLHAKWYWMHFLNTIGVLMSAAWRIYRATAIEKDMSLLTFTRSVVQSYLHMDKIMGGPRVSWQKGNKTKTPDAVKLTGNHWPKRVENQRRCQYQKCQKKVRFICTRCDKGLCIESDHFIKYHE